MRPKRQINQCMTRFPALIFLLLFSASLWGQDEAQQFIQSRFNQYNQQVLQEKVYVHTDKSFYLAGEVLWFKIYNVEGSSNTPLDLSKLAYIEIINTEQKAVLQAKISLKKGSGSGSFFLPLTLNSGNYVLRAYTNWMKNFSPEYFFEKNITIVNSLKRLGARPAEGRPAYDIQFFPEGGNLVNGIESKIGFRVVDQHGKGVDFRGSLTDSNNNTVASFAPLSFGLGHFSFTPQRNTSYRAIIKLDSNNVVVSDFPSSYDVGYVMKLEDAGTGKLSVTVNTNEHSPSRFIYLLVTSRQKIKAAESGEVVDGKVIFQVDRSQLEDGISVFTLFNGYRQPLCERLYFKRPGQADMEASSDQAQYDFRKKVRINIQVHGRDTATRKADLSISVYQVDSLQIQEDPDILSYLWLNSDIQGIIESPSYYLRDSSEEINQATDNLMLTQGWRRFRWEDLLQDKKPLFEYVPEYEGHIISGKITDKRTGAPLGDVSTYVSVPGQKFQVGNSISNKNGQIQFDIKNFFGSSEIVVQTDNQKDTNFRIDILSPFSEKYSSKTIPAFNVAEDYADQILAHSIGIQVQNAYLTDSLQKVSIPYFLDSTAFYGQPDHKYFLDDYTRFITMEEVIREYVSGVSLRKRRQKFHLAVVNEPRHFIFDNDPLMLLDGVPIFDADKIIAFDPLKTKKIEVVTKQYFLGAATESGIVSFFTYQGDLAGFPLDPNALVVEYDGLQLKREFYSPVYETANQISSRIPDYRNVLYWSGDARPDADGRKQLSFYTSDRPGKYAVVIQGLTIDGKAVSKTFTFDVR
jgi:hypothetical protein